MDTAQLWDNLVLLVDRGVEHNMWFRCEKPVNQILHATVKNEAQSAGINLILLPLGFGEGNTNMIKEAVCGTDGPTKSPT